MKFDLNSILSIFGSKKKRNIKDFEDKEEALNKEIEEEFEEDIFEEEEDDEGEILEEKEKAKSKESKKKSFNKKLPINFKDKKVQISIAAIAVLAIGAVSAPYIMSYIGEKQADNIGNVSGITEMAQMTKPKPRPAVAPNRNNTNRTYYNKPKIKHTNMAQNKKNIHIQNHRNMKIGQTQNRINITRENNSVKYAKNLNINNNNLSNADKIKRIEQSIEGTNKKIREIQQHLVNAKLQGENDPIGMVDKTIMQNRNFDLYLQSQVQLMRKLVSFYKQKAELQKTLRLYKMAFGKNYKTNENKNNNQEQKNLQETLQKVVAPLQQQIVMLKQELAKANEKKAKQNSYKQKQQQTNIDFDQMTKMNLNDLNIFIKNGKYIAVVHTSVGDKIFKIGDYFNGYKIDKILPNMIVFEKDGQKFYYTYNQTLNQKYETAKIALPGKISENEVKEKRNNRKDQIKQYKPVSRQKLLQQLLQKKLKQIR